MNLERQLLAQFATDHPAEVASALAAMSHREAALVLGDLAPAVAASLLHYLPSLSAALALEQLSTEDAATILTAVRPDIAASILRATPSERQAAVVKCFPARRQAVIANLLIYAEDTAGALMDPQVITAFEQEPVQPSARAAPAQSRARPLLSLRSSRGSATRRRRQYARVNGRAARCLARVRLHAPRRIHCRQRHLANRGGTPSVGQRPRATRSGHSGPVRRCPPLRNRTGFGAMAS